jgi:type I restriction enzyme S subunit
MMKNLDELCEFKNGLWRGKKGPFKPIRILRNTNFSDDGRFNFMDVAMHEVEIKQLESRALEYGDILLERSGGGPKQPVGRVALFDIRDDKGEYSFSNFTTRIRVKDKEELNEKFLWRFLYYFYTNGETAKMQKQTHGIRNLDFSEYKQIKVPLPNLSEQNRIVDILEKADNLCRKRQEADKLSDKTMRSIFLEMFGDPNNNFKDIDMKKINVVTEHCQRRDPTKKPNISFKYVDISGVNGDKGIIETYKEIKGKDAPSRARQIIHSNDVIISTVRPNLKATALVPEFLDDQICSTGFCVLRPTERVNHYYLYAITRMEWFTALLVSKVRGASYPAVTDKVILEIEIPAPVISNQKKFADLVQKVEKIKEKQRESKVELDNLFNSLMHRFFSGGMEN